MKAVSTSAAAKLAALLLPCLLGAACTSLSIQPTAAPNAMDITMGTYGSADLSRYIIVTMTDAMHRQLAQDERVDSSTLPPLYAKFIGNLAGTYGMRRVADWPLNSLGIRCLVFEVAVPGPLAPTIAALSRERFVETVQPLSAFETSSDATGNTVAHAAPAPSGVYNDPYRDLQSGFATMQVPESHRWATGKGVRIAVIDTGLDTRHAELRDRIEGIRNFVDRDQAAFNADVHGTAVAGVIAAASNNGIGVVGVAPEAQLLGLKACWRGDQASRAHCNTFTLAKAINFAIDQEVDVINLSLGGPPDPLLARLVARAAQRNILVVGAVNPKWVEGFPAGVDGVIGVINSGTEAGAAAGRYLSAPGNQVLSTSPNDDYDFFTGSSFSAAEVTGIAALIRQRKSHLSASVIKDLIMDTSHAEPRSVNACEALARVIAQGQCNPATRVAL
jgi:hypothetical protein